MLTFASRSSLSSGLFSLKRISATADAFKRRTYRSSCSMVASAASDNVTSPVQAVGRSPIAETTHAKDLLSICQHAKKEISKAVRLKELQVAAADEALVAQHHARCEEVRAALWEAVARGRQRQPRPLVNQVFDRRSSPLAAGLLLEDLEYCVDADHHQGWVPLRIIKKAPAMSLAPDVADKGTLAGPEPSPPVPKHGHASASDGVAGSAHPPQRLPVVVFMHATGSDMNSMAQYQEEYATAGYLTAAIDCGYHGDRCRPDASTTRRDVYEDALVRAYLEGPDRVFLLDNVWDLVHLLDVLVGRPDVDPTRIGMTGVSLGGMHSWLAAALDPRVAAAAPIIGVQGFRWALEHDAWHDRVASIPRVFDTAARHMGKAKVDVEVVTAVWNKILPGLLDHYDAPHSLPTIAPRPLLVLNGEVDGRCPVEGVKLAFASAQRAYELLQRVQRRQQWHQEQQTRLAHHTRGDVATPALQLNPDKGTKCVRTSPPSSSPVPLPLTPSSEVPPSALDQLPGSREPSSSHTCLTPEERAAALHGAAAGAAAAAEEEEASAAAQEVLDEEAAAVSAAVAERLTLFIEGGTGHKVTPAMNRAVRSFFDKHLQQDRR